MASLSTSLSTYIQEKLKVDKDYNYTPEYDIKPKDKQELLKIIQQRVIDAKGGTEKNPVDLNDIDVGSISDFYNLFSYVNEWVKIVAIDITDWDVSQAENFGGLFKNCKFLKTVGDLSYWKVDKVNTMKSMFEGCHKLKFIGNISKWNVESVMNFASMFRNCEKLPYIDIDKWRVNNALVKDNVKMIISGTSGWKMPSWVRSIK